MVNLKNELLQLSNFQKLLFFTFTSHFEFKTKNIYICVFKKMVKTFENNYCALLFDYLKFTEKRFQMLPKFSSQPRYN